MSWNAKVRCVDDKGGEHTKGKIYNVENGKIRYDKGVLSVFEYKNIDDLNKGFGSQFELVEEDEEWDSETDTDNNVGNITDNINNPSHYNQYRVEVIDIIEDATKNLKGIEAVCVSNILKYILRYQFKNGIEDIKKCRWYIDKLIKAKGNNHEVHS